MQNKRRMMSKKIIPIIQTANHSDNWLATTQLQTATGSLFDTRQRPLQDLRISVTDRCNFRCTYCMPKEVFNKDYPYLPHGDLLSFEEILRIAQLFVAHGVRKIRLTGGEPLLRKNIEDLVAMLSALRTVDGEAIDLTLTTNGALLARKAQSLKDAGLSRITVSLDALDDAMFKRMNDVDFPVSDVLEGIQAASAAGFKDIKINMVVKGGTNDQEVIPMARYFKSSGHILRFIEYMDVGASNGWKLDEVIPSAEIIEKLEQAGMRLLPLGSQSASETATRWQHSDGQGEIGFISSVSQAFCHSCSRARLSTQGKLYTCLFASEGHDLRALLRHQQEGHVDQKLSHLIAQVWQTRGDHYSELRHQQTDLTQRKKIEMSYIGG
jgi:cyclic pyranopterin phosphate synthase